MKHAGNIQIVYSLSMQYLYNKWIDNHVYPTQWINKWINIEMYRMLTRYAIAITDNTKWFWHTNPNVFGLLFDRKKAWILIFISHTFLSFDG